MAKRPSISSILSGFTSAATINANFNSIKEAFDNLLSLDGSTPNSMLADLDMNSNDINNAGSINADNLKIGGSTFNLSGLSGLGSVASRFLSSAATDPTTRDDGTALQTGDIYFNTVDDEMYVYSGVAFVPFHTGSTVVDRFSGDGSTVDFTLTRDPISENNTQVFVAGTYVQKDAYSVSDTTLTFASAPANGSDNVEVVTFDVVGDAGGTIPVVTSIAALAAANQEGVVFLDAAGRSGMFKFDSSDLSTEVTLDTETGIFVPPTGETGSAGAFVRIGFEVGLQTEWFGAVAGGTGDDHTAMQAAVDFAYGYNSAPFEGMKTYLQPNRYSLSEPLTLPPFTKLIGSGKGSTTIRARTGFTGQSVLVDQPETAELGATNIVLEDFTIDCNQLANVRYGLKCESLQRATLRNIKVQNPYTGAALEVTPVAVSNNFSCSTAVLDELENGDPVFVFADAKIPSNLDAMETYYITGKTASVVELSTDRLSALKDDGTNLVSFNNNGTGSNSVYFWKSPIAAFYFGSWNDSGTFRNSNRVLLEGCEALDFPDSVVLTQDEDDPASFGASFFKFHRCQFAGFTRKGVSFESGEGNTTDSCSVTSNENNVTCVYNNDTVATHTALHVDSSKETSPLKYDITASDDGGSLLFGAVELEDTFTGTGDGTTDTFTLAYSPSSVSAILVRVDGKFVDRSTDNYSVSGTDVTFVTAPSSGAAVKIYNSSRSDLLAKLYGIGIADFQNGHPFQVEAVSLPTGISALTTYYATRVDYDEETFRISETHSAAVDESSFISHTNNGTTVQITNRTLVADNTVNRWGQLGGINVNRNIGIYFSDIAGGGNVLGLLGNGNFYRVDFENVSARNKTNVFRDDYNQMGTLDVKELQVVSANAENENAKILSGSVAPETNVIATAGSLYLRTTGGADTTLYVKESGTGTSGWTAMAGV